ncbi:MAG: BadF/BadG/BcrA/BcrD ATPase family protein [Anaerohalosphaeraceae bacterium]
MYFLGIDGGGTKTAAILLNTDTGQARSLSLPGGNICVLGQSGCKSLLAQIIAKLLSGIQTDEIAYATFAFAGTGRPTERGWVETVAAELGFRQFSVITDAQLLHYSFFADTPGILIASGTGSVCLLTTPDGQYRQLGGWGYLLGDAGSGFHIGRLAIGGALDHMDKGRQPTRFTEALLQFYHAQSLRELITLTYAAPSPQRFVASCAQQVIELAADNDPDALHIVESATDALVQLARTAIHHMQASSGKIQIALAGGILTADSIVSRIVKHKLSESNKTIEYMPQLCTPAAAAVFHAAARHGFSICDKDRQTLSNLLLTETEPPDCER